MDGDEMSASLPGYWEKTKYLLLWESNIDSWAIHLLA
jgi:hypothetical protein